MDPKFWIDKWEKQETGFHLTQAHPLLKKYYQDSLENAQGIFVPLCGKTSDLVYLADSKKPIYGCELSEKALDAFFQENSLLPQKSYSEPFVLYKHQLLTLICGDFFDVKKEHLPECDGIYDRAALIALPEPMRRRYVEHMKNIMPQAAMLLVTLEYPQEQMSGPPFSVENNEIEALFAFAQVKSVYTKNILDKEPKFAKRGLSYLNECAYIIQW